MFARSENRAGWSRPKQDVAPTYHNRDKGLHNESGAHRRHESHRGRVKSTRETSERRTRENVAA